MSAIQQTPGVAPARAAEAAAAAAAGTTGAAAAAAIVGPTEALVGASSLVDRRWSASRCCSSTRSPGCSSASLKPRGEVFDNALIPKTFMPENYVEVWNQLPLLQLDVQQHRHRPARGRTASRSRARSSRSASPTSSSPAARCCSGWCSPR